MGFFFTAVELRSCYCASCISLIVAGISRPIPFNPSRLVVLAVEVACPSFGIESTVSSCYHCETMTVDTKVIKLRNCRLAVGDSLVWRDLLVSQKTGKILDPQAAFFEQHITPTDVHDVGGRIVSPGFIDVQLNGCFGMDFSVPSTRYGEQLRRVNRELVKTGVTSYLPTLTSQNSHVYHKV